MKSAAKPAPGGAAAARSSVWARLGSAAAAKVLVMGLSGLLGIITSRMIISNFGIEAYAQYGLLASLPALVPFADLGVGAVVVNAVAASDDPRRDERVRRTLTTAFRILLVSGPVIVLAATVVTVLGLWPALLGNGLMPGGSAVVLACVCVFGLVLPLTAGQRILVATGRTGTQIATQGIIAPFILLSVSALVVFEVPAGRWLAVLSFLGTALVSLLCLVAGSFVLRPQVTRAVRDIPRLRSVPSVPVIAVAGPMLFQMVLLPVATQSDRLLLSHLTTGSELAEYQVGSQLFGIALQTVTAAGVALWPVFARARAQGEIRSPGRLAAVFGLVGLALGTVVAVASPVLVDFVSDGELRLDRLLVLAFVSLVTVQALKYPLGMYMTDERGLRFQIVPITLLVPSQVALSWQLIEVVGPAGPVLSGAAVGMVCQVLPYWWYVSRDLRRRQEAGRSGGAAASPA